MFTVQIFLFTKIIPYFNLNFCNIYNFKQNNLLNKSIKIFLNCSVKYYLFKTLVKKNPNFLPIYMI